MFTWYWIKGLKAANEESSAWSHRDIGVWSMLCISVPRGKGDRESYDGAKKITEI
jgi:hypothetical protein